MSATKENLLLFFDRPTEPCFMKKGQEGATFDIPEHYYPEKYKKVAGTLASRFGANSRNILVRNISLPNLDLSRELAYQDHFSLFIPKHKRMAANLTDIFMGMRDLEDLQSICSYCQLHVNPYMFNYCLSVVLLHRPDTKGMDIPSLAQSFPDKFVAPKVFRQVRELTSTVKDQPRMPVTIPMNYTASEWEPEQRVAYFREDIGVNLHHWHWHLVYPSEGSRTVVNKDRRGELFYYMHQQIMARYTIERFCNNLGVVKRYENLREPIEEGYFPKLDSQVASRAWPPRFAGSTIRDLDRPVEEIRSEVVELELWRDRILRTIESNSILLPGGRTVPLDEERGIDILGNIMEASIISPNRQYYGNYHNMGHVYISYVHDPDHRNLEQFGVMGDSGTAMRDPIFYRWHAHVDDIFQMYKSKLPPYKAEALIFSGIDVRSIAIDGKAGRNTLSTYWEQSLIDIGMGMDFTPRGSMPARITHLQHEEYNYVIEVNNTTGRGAMGTFRIFMAPEVDNNGTPIPFSEQRKLMIELDKFSHPLKTGKNIVRRRSIDSSVTIPYERSFRSQTNRPGKPGSDTAAEFDFCGCGWPHHMLIPKGTTGGYRMKLFVMVSNWMNDSIKQETVGSCNDAASYCGIRDRRYPDKRAMGYPFDRPLHKGITELNDFLLPNMAVADCTINFTDVTKQRAQ